MAHHKSAIKRIKQSQKRLERNRSNRTKLKNTIRAFNEAIDASAENKSELLAKAISTLSKSASKGLIPARRASRKISRLTKKFNASNV